MKNTQVSIKSDLGLADFQQVINLLSQLLTHDDLEEIKAAMVKEWSLGHRYILAYIGDELVGLVSGRKEGRPRHGLAELVHLVVSQQAQGRGIGRQLVEELEKWLINDFKINRSDLRRLFLLTRETNHHAHEFYKKQGFVPEQLLLNHFYEGENELVMAKYYNV